MNIFLNPLEFIKLCTFNFSKPDAPATPDYLGAANATAAGNLDAAKYATIANRVNQYTPYGDLIYTQGTGQFDQAGYDQALANYNKQLAAYNSQAPGSSSQYSSNFGVNGAKNGNMPVAPNRKSFYQGGNPDQWSATVNLSPTGQKLLDYQNATSLGLGDQTAKALGRVNDSLTDPFDYNSVQDVQDAAYQSYTSRLDPQWQQQREQLDSQLANQGITLGSQAYDNAMRNFNQGRNDAYQQATTAAINLSPQTLQLAQALRSQPLNELNALRTGSQVTNPTFQTVPQQATTAGADVLGATQAGYNSQLGAYNAQNASSGNMLGGLFSLGAAIGGAPTTSLFGKWLGG